MKSFTKAAPTKLLTRLIISFVLVFGAGFYFFVYRTQAAKRAIDNHTHSIQNFDQALQKARERLKDILPPSSIKPGKPGAKDYSAVLAAAKGSFDPAQPSIPQPITDNNNQIAQRFNAIITDPDYRQTIISAAAVLKADQQFLGYQSAVVSALANILQYNPSEDLATKDTTILTQHLQAAEAGIEATIEKLNSLTTYQGDSGLEQLKKVVQSVQNSRRTVMEALGSTAYSTRKQDYIEVVFNAQNRIILNRQSFWETESNELYKASDQSEKAIHFYLVQLQHL